MNLIIEMSIAIYQEDQEQTKQKKRKKKQRLLKQIQNL